MKRTHRCPKCAHEVILYIPQVADNSGDRGIQPMNLAKVSKQRRTFAFTVTENSVAGELEAMVCRSCGYTEFYTRDPGSLVVDGQSIQQRTPKARDD